MSTTDSRGSVTRVPRTQFRFLLGFPGYGQPVEAVLDTGAPLLLVPQRIWDRLRHGTDFEWLGFPPGSTPPSGRILGWQFPFRMARLLGPVTVIGYGGPVVRRDIVAQFASGNPPVHLTKAPIVIAGLWSGLLEGSSLHIDRDQSTGRPAGTLEFK